MGSDYRGDPASAMLEVLDPEQNATFRDHYLDVPFDLSRVMFITTANTLDTVPGPAARPHGGDPARRLHGGGEAPDRQALPRAAPDRAHRPEEARRSRSPTRACRTIIARVHARGRRARARARDRRGVPQGRARAWPRASTSARSRSPRRACASCSGARASSPRRGGARSQPGVATGLAWTPVGGDVLFVEASAMPGKGKLTVTGQLGDVMQESAQAALSWVRGARRARRRTGSPRHDLHVHVPAGAVPKDGPSAGITMATALMSLITGRPVRDDTAMTGEITLTGQVLPIGGLKEKALAAQRAGHHARDRAAPQRARPRGPARAPARRRWSSSGRARSSEVLDAALEAPADGAVSTPGADPGSRTGPPSPPGSVRARCARSSPPRLGRRVGFLLLTLPLGHHLLRAC